MSGPRWVTSIEDLAHACEVAPATLRKYARDGCPCKTADKTPGRGYHVSAVRRWLKAHNAWKRPHGRPRKFDDAQGDGGPDTHQRIREAQAEEREYKAKMARLAYEEKRGEVITKDDMLRRHAYVRGELEGWIRTLGPRLAGKTALEIMEILEGRVEALLERFAE